MDNPTIESVLYLHLHRYNVFYRIELCEDDDYEILDERTECMLDYVKAMIEETRNDERISHNKFAYVYNIYNSLATNDRERIEGNDCPLYQFFSHDTETTTDVIIDKYPHIGLGMYRLLCDLSIIHLKQYQTHHMENTKAFYSVRDYSDYVTLANKHWDKHTIFFMFHLYHIHPQWFLEYITERVKLKIDSDYANIKRMFRYFHFFMHRNSTHNDESLKQFVMSSLTYTTEIAQALADFYRYEDRNERLFPRTREYVLTLAP